MPDPEFFEICPCILPEAIRSNAGLVVDVSYLLSKGPTSIEKRGEEFRTRRSAFDTNFFVVDFRSAVIESAVALF